MLSKKSFIRINKLTLVSVYVLILVGGIVRTLGAGMGCPDWPKCFGKYIPPTSDSELPANYQEIFKKKRIAKNHRLANTFSKLGYEELASSIISDPKVEEEQRFNVTKAWVEYLNRLVGVLIGLFVFLNMIFSFSFSKKPIIPILAVSVFVLTGFQGWVGSLVVSTNLLSGFISFHMILALVIVSLLILLHKYSSGAVLAINKPLFVIVSLLCLLILPQIVMGTEVRGLVDELIYKNIPRNIWLSKMSTMFFIHRSYSWIIFVLSIVGSYLVFKQKVAVLYTPFLILLVLVVLEMGAGIGMNYFSFPFWLQPIHLILGAGLYGVVFYSLLRLRFT